MKRTLLFFALIISGTLLAQEVRTIDGSNNNLANPEWGAADETLQAFVSNGYTDQISLPAGLDRPNPRMLSNLLFSQSGLLNDQMGLSDYTWVWGQFVDHDITLNPDSDEFYPIPVPAGDPWFDPFNTGSMIIPMNRSIFDPASGTDPSNPRVHVNKITAFIDGSAVYGSDYERADWLRTFNGGKLKMSAGDLLPFNTITGEYDDPIDPEAPEMDDAVGVSPKHFVAGDVRANEQPLLIAFHTLFVREHNRLCDSLFFHHPDWNDEEIYQHARRIVGGLMQSIVYNEWLPSMGVHLAPYRGYNPMVNPQIANIFSTAAFRFGHTLLNSTIQRLDMDGNVIPEGNLELKDGFFNPQVIEDAGGIEPYFKGMATQVQQSLDAKIIDDVRNFLFGPPGAGGLDLAAININRGRERGLPHFNKIRQDIGLPMYSSFDEINPDPDVYQLLDQAYNGDINSIDPWVGMLAEEALSGALFGKTMMTILEKQFRAIRDGDRFFYKNDPALKPAEKMEIENTRLVDVIRRNTGIPIMQDYLFEAMDHEDVPVCTANPGNTSTIEGSVNTEIGQPIDSVDVQLFDGYSMKPSYISSTDGIFHFLDLPMCYDYMVIPYKNTDADNGVSVYDLIKTQKHILGVEDLDSPYKIIAADANNSGVVSTSDLIDMRKVILHNIEAFPNNTSWRFVTTNYVFNDPQNPLKEDWPKMDMVDMLSSEANLAFMGIKIGDIDNSADPEDGLADPEAENRTLAQTFYLEVADKFLQEGEMVTIPFFAADLDQIAGYQFTLNYNPAFASFVDLETGNSEDLTIDNFGLILEKGAITSVWNGQSEKTDQPVFYLTLQAQQKVKISELLTLNSRITHAEAYNSSLEKMNVALRYRGEDNTVSKAFPFELYQNTPNPFAQQTTVGFQLPESSTATLTIFDLSGRVLQRIEGNYTKGYNEINISKSNLDASGILYYQLQTPEFAATRKMVILD